MNRFVTCAGAVYRRLLVLCPRDLRAQFADEMVLVFSEDLADTVQRHGMAAGLWLCGRAVAELACIVISSALRTPDILTSVLTSLLTIICFAAEFAIAQAHSSPSFHLPPRHVCAALFLIPGLTAAIVSFLAARTASHDNLQRLLH